MKNFLFVLKKTLKLFALTFPILFSTSDAFALDSVTVKMDDLFIVPSSSLKAKDIPNKELTVPNKKVTFFKHKVGDSWCHRTFYINATLLSTGKVKLEDGTEGGGWMSESGNKSVSKTLSSGKIYKTTHQGCGFSVTTHVELAPGKYKIACPNSLPKNYLIAKSNGPMSTSKAYFSSVATLKTSSSSECTYTGQVTVDYTHPTGSGSSTSTATASFPFNDISALIKK